MTGQQIVQALMRQGITEPRKMPPLKRLRASGVQVIQKQKAMVQEMVKAGVPKARAIQRAQHRTAWWTHRKIRRKER